MDDPLLTIDEVVAYLRVNRRTVYRLLTRGELPGTRVGRQWRVRRSSLEAWVESRTTAVERDATPVRDIEPVRALGQRRVLVADDDANVRMVLKEALTRAGYHVDIVAEGASALQRLQNEMYDVVITDLKMPGVNGMTVIRAANLASPSPAVVIITGYPSEATAIAAVNAGVRGYLTKPFHVSDVLAVVQKALGA